MLKIIAGSPTRGLLAVEEMSALGQVEGELCDLRSFEQVKMMIDEAERKFGGVDILVNNAGIGIFKPVEELAAEEFRAVLETNELMG